MSDQGERGSEARLVHVKQLLKFGAVGFLNTGVDFGIFTILTMTTSLAAIACHIISYSVGVINSYFFNRLWTFKVKRRANSLEFSKFIVVNLISLGVSTLVFYLVNDKAGLSSLVSKLGATFCSLIVNFIGSKFIVFKNSQYTKDETNK